jgi:hypothetical protein
MSQSRFRQRPGQLLSADGAKVDHEVRQCPSSTIFYWKSPSGKTKISSALSKLKSGVSILLAVPFFLGKRKLEAYATTSSGVSILLAIPHPVAIPFFLGKRKLEAYATNLEWGKHPACHTASCCHTFFLGKRKLEAYATTLSGVSILLAIPHPVAIPFSWQTQAGSLRHNLEWGKHPACHTASCLPYLFPGKRKLEAYATTWSGVSILLAIPHPVAIPFSWQTQAGSLRH